MSRARSILDFLKNTYQLMLRNLETILQLWLMILRVCAMEKMEHSLGTTQKGLINLYQRSWHTCSPSTRY